jgi:unspecific monooxygenase
MHRVSQSPKAPDFVQNPYPFYAAARSQGPLAYWEEYAMPAAFSHAAVHMLLRDLRCGRECPAGMAPPVPEHLAPFMKAEQHSLLELEPPRHTRLRKLVTRAFTSSAVAGLAPQIEALCHDLIDAFPDQPFDLLPAFCTQVPVITICRLLGVPEAMAPQLLQWSHDMVAMYQAGRDAAAEHQAAAAANAFAAFLRSYIEERRSTPREDLITALIAAGEDGETLSTDELISTVILLLNAGHEATVHALGNAVKTLLQQGLQPQWLAPEAIEGTVEELLRFDPPLHLFTRYAYEEAEVFGHTFQRGGQVALLLAAASHDPAACAHPDRFDPLRPPKINKAFGGGLHFCVGAPLARLEMQIALPILFARCPDLKLDGAPQYSDTYHFHGLRSLMVAR